MESDGVFLYRAHHGNSNQVTLHRQGRRCRAAHVVHDTTAPCSNMGRLLVDTELLGGRRGQGKGNILAKQNVLCIICAMGEKEEGSWRIFPSPQSRAGGQASLCSVVPLGITVCYYHFAYTGTCH